MAINIAASEYEKFLIAEGTRHAVSLMEDDSQSVLDPLVLFLERLREGDSPETQSALSMHSEVAKQVARSELSLIAYECIEKASKMLGDESDVRKKVLSRLSHNFSIEEEVWGTHWSGKRMRIDAIVIPKDDSGWKTKRPRLGIEFKNFRGFRASFDMKDYTKWWAQCHDYAETKFDGHGYVYVFSYNGFSHYRQRAGRESSAAFAVRFWGRLGVGELQPTEDGYPRQKSLMFVLNGTNKVWSEARGVLDGGRISMERKFGSR